MAAIIKKPLSIHCWFLRKLDPIAQMSKDPNTKVGAIVAIDDKTKGEGYNGFPPGVKDFVNRWEKPLKYKFVVHAEVNAILNCDHVPRGGTLYVPFWPCEDCAKIIAAAGIKKVVAGGDYYKNDFTEVIFKEAGIELLEIPKDIWSKN